MESAVVGSVALYCLVRARLWPSCHGPSWPGREPDWPRIRTFFVSLPPGATPSPFSASATYGTSRRKARTSCAK